jgi:hypothetical protein
MDIKGGAAPLLRIAVACRRPSRHVRCDTPERIRYPGRAGGIVTYVEHRVPLWDAILRHCVYYLTSTRLFI